MSARCCDCHVSRVTCNAEHILQRVMRDFDELFQLCHLGNRAKVRARLRPSGFMFCCDGGLSGC